MSREKLDQFGDFLRLRRVSGGNRNRAEFARSLGLRNDRVLNDLENGVRDNYSDDTLAAVDIWYGLPAGTAAQAIKEGEWDERNAAPIGAESPAGTETSTASVPTDTVPVIEERRGEVTGRNVVKVKFAALGVEVETTYTDAEDRAAVLSEIMAAVGLTGELDGQGDSDRA